MAFWYLTSTFGSLWVLLTNAGVRNEAVTAQIASTGLSENAFLMFFFAGFAFVAGGWRSRCTRAAIRCRTTTGPPDRRRFTPGTD